jgi:hypothetical protein
MNEQGLITAINDSMGISIPSTVNADELRLHLSDYINFLIQSDFQRLVQLLYRIDISENRLKELLKKNEGRDAAPLIADMIIERQLQKIKSRREFPGTGDPIDENERW